MRGSAVIILAFVSLAFATTIVSEFHVRTIETNLRRLEWKTQQESDLREFRIQRSTNQQDWSLIGTVPALQDGASSHDYMFDDTRILKTETTTLYYKLVLVDLQGNTTDHHAIASTAGVSGIRHTWGSLKAMFR
ncbi:hypothetical protein JXO52_15680 [bacterium]|nr:hypothetical protein [bacterium]